MPTLHLLPHEDEAAFAALRSCLLTRHAPADPAEQHWVEQIAAAMWRQRRLQALETRVLGSLLTDDTNEPDASRPALPSLATLARYLARIERDHRLALTELERLQEQRRRQPRGNPAQLRFMAELLERSPDTSEPEPLPTEAPLLNRHERRRQAALERAMA